MLSSLAPSPRVSQTAFPHEQRDVSNHDETAPLERRIAQLRDALAKTARAGERVFFPIVAGLPRADTLRGRMNALNVERETLESELEARFPDPSRAARNLESSVHSELKREAAIDRNFRASAMLNYARALASCTQDVSDFFLLHAREPSPHPGSQMWLTQVPNDPNRGTARVLTGMAGFMALDDADQVAVRELAALSMKFLQAERVYMKSLAPLHEPERSAVALERFNRDYSAAPQHVRIHFVDFLNRNLPKRPADPHGLMEDISELVGRDLLAPLIRPLLEDFFLLPSCVRDGHYTVLLALAGKMFQRLEDTTILEIEADDPPTLANLRAIVDGYQDAQALQRALALHAPDAAVAQDASAAFFALESYRGNLPRMEDAGGRA